MMNCDLVVQVSSVLPSSKMLLCSVYHSNRKELGQALQRTVAGETFGMGALDPLSRPRGSDQGCANSTNCAPDELKFTSLVSYQYLFQLNFLNLKLI